MGRFLIGYQRLNSFHLIFKSGSIPIPTKFPLRRMPRAFPKKILWQLPYATNPQEVLNAISIVFHQDTCEGVSQVKRRRQQLD